MSQLHAGVLALHSLVLPSRRTRKNVMVYGRVEQGHLLGQRGVKDAVAAKALVEAHGAAEHAAEADVLAEAERPGAWQQAVPCLCVHC
jgi:hypothetical protein